MKGKKNRERRKKGGKRTTHKVCGSSEGKVFIECLTF